MTREQYPASVYGQDVKRTAAAADVYQSQLNSAKKWRTFILILALFQFGIIMAIVVTWIFNFSGAMTLVLISLLEVGNIFSFVIILVVFFHYKSWTKADEISKPGYPILLVLVTVESLSLVAIVAEFIWRIILIATCTSGDPCSVDPQWVTAIVLLTICCVSLLTAFFAVIAAFKLFGKLKTLSATMSQMRDQRQDEAAPQHYTTQIATARFSAGQAYNQPQYRRVTVHSDWKQH
jgi:uncharacterized membrane-anchored protein